MALDAPTGLAAVVNPAGSLRIALTWDALTPPGRAIIQRATGAGEYSDVYNADTDSGVDNGYGPGGQRSFYDAPGVGTHHYKILARDPNSEEADSPLSSAVDIVVAADTTPPTVESAEASDLLGNGQGTTLEITFSEYVSGIDAADYVLSTGQVLSNPRARSYYDTSGISVDQSDRRYIFDVTPAAAEGDVLPNLAYSGTTTVDLAGNAMDPFAAAGDSTGPALTSAAVVETAASVVLTFTETDSPPLLPASGITGFSLTVNGAARTITSATRTGDNEITLTVVGYIGKGQTVLVTYAGGNVTDSAETPNVLAGFSNQAVTNNSGITILMILTSSTGFGTDGI